MPGDGHDVAVLQAADLDAGLGQTAEADLRLRSEVQVGDERDAVGLRALLVERREVDGGDPLGVVLEDDAAACLAAVRVGVLAADDAVAVFVGKGPRFGLDDSGQVPAHRGDQSGHALGDSQGLALGGLL